MSKRLNVTLLTPLSEGSDVRTKVGLLLVHRSNLGRMPLLLPSVTRICTSGS